MGDLIMSAPAIRALKQTFSAKITVLTSSMAAGISAYLPEIDEVIVFDLPWVKAKTAIASDQIFTLTGLLKQRNFDAAVIFTVFSQNAMPAAMVAFMAGIPLRLAYSRENPYTLLTHWVPDKEPYNFIRHQVERDLFLVNSVGAVTVERQLRLTVPANALENAFAKMMVKGINVSKPWLIIHAGVSETKREYPRECWVEAARKLINLNGFQILFTGVSSEKELCDYLAEKTGGQAFSLAGLFQLEEFIALIDAAPLVLSVNTGTVHVAAAVNTPVVVLYAQTNPQHTPWMVANKVLEFEVAEAERSKNEVIQYLYKHHYNPPVSLPRAEDIYNAAIELLQKTSPKAAG